MKEDWFISDASSSVKLKFPTSCEDTEERLNILHSYFIVNYYNSVRVSVW